MRHALTVDVEDWYHDPAIRGSNTDDSRVERNTIRLLEVLEESASTATFFFLAELAKRFPTLVRKVADAGHEVASHGYRHRPLQQLLRHEFRDDVARSLATIEDTSGTRVCGYRAPCFSIRSGVRWPLETLLELGVVYDSSILPVDRPPGLDLVCPRSPFRHENGLWEFPVGVFQVFFFWHFPLASGTGLRLLPPALLARFLRRFERDVGAGVFYLHPWELDPCSPVRAGPSGWFLRLGRGGLPGRLKALLGERSFGSIADVFGAKFLGRSEVPRV